MRIKNKSFILFIILLSILISGCKTSYSPNDVIAYVNGEPIYNQEIENVYMQYKEHGVLREKIIDDTILQILVIQQANGFHIHVSDDELDHTLSEFKTSYPYYYQEAVKQIGIDALRKNLKDRALFSKVKDYVLENELLIDDVTVQEFICENKLESHLSKYSFNQLRELLSKDLQEFAFQKWMTSLKQNANIVFCN